MSDIDIHHSEISENNIYAVNLLKDEICVKITNRITELYKQKYSNTAMMTNMLSLIKEFGDHYLLSYYIGNHCSEIGEYISSISWYNTSINNHPFVDAFLNLAIICIKLGDHDSAERILEESLKVDKDDFRAISMIGTVKYSAKKYYDAVSYFLKLIDIKTSDIIGLKNVYNNLAFSYTAIGKCKKALKYFNDGLKLNSEESIELTRINLQLLQNKLVNFDYVYDIPNNYFDDFLSINNILKPNHLCKNKLVMTNDKINIGIISPDLRQHVCSFFVKPILSNFNKNKFNYYCYANVANEDIVCETFKKFNGIKWFNIDKKNDLEVSNLILSHNITILIDLAGHTHRNCLSVMALKPAPILVTYLGYPNSTGMTNIDYRITDNYADPIDTKQQYSEKLVRLPRCFVCYSNDIPLEQLPINYKTKNKIVFGVMNKVNKQNKHTFKVWSEILKRVPNSELYLKCDIKSDTNTKEKYL